MPHKYSPGPMYAALIDPERCAARVPFGGRMMDSHQCSRKPWKDGWCKQHHPDSEAKRREEADKRYEAKLTAIIANDPEVKLARMTEERDVLLTACRVALNSLEYIERIKPNLSGYGVRQNCMTQLRDAIKGGGG